MKVDNLNICITSDVVLKARPWPQCASRPNFMALASGPMALTSKAQALALRFWP